MNINWNKSLEEEVRKFWRENFIYEKWILRNINKETFKFLEGPPYTTGMPHIGHAFNRTMKDIIIRYYNKKGYNIKNQAGFDMHGLPIEEKVEEKLKLKDKREIYEIGVENFIRECFNFAYGSMNEFSKFYEDIAHWVDTDNPYLPITNEYIEKVWEALARGYEKNLVYEDKKPVWWCPRCQTTLSKQEIELGYEDPMYKKSIDNAIYVKFKSKNIKDTYFIIWTTTPWTLVYNLGIMINPELKYVKIKVPRVYIKELELDYNNHKTLRMDIEKEDNYEYWIIAKDALERLINKLNINYEIIEEYDGKDLEFEEYYPVFYEELNTYLDNIRNKEAGAFRLWLSKEYVNSLEGTGLVHAAPGCGPEDYEVGRKYNVSAFNTTDETGTIKELPYFNDLKAKKDDYEFIKKLIEKKALLYFEWYEHDYPICWRCRTKAIIRTTFQWFINVAKMKEKLLLDVEKVKFISEAAKNGFVNIIKSAPDWVISRQRFWGLTLPIWRDKNGHTKFVRDLEELSNLTGKEFKKIYIIIKYNDYAEKMLKRYHNREFIYEKDIKSKEEIINIFNKYNNNDIIIVNNFNKDLLKDLNELYYVRSYGNRDYEIIYLYNYNLHRPHVDKYTFKCYICGEEMKRIPDVIDVWVDSGSATFATNNYPVDFITENYDQIKGWFYSLAVLGELYYDDIPYRNVYVGGYVNDALGRKMSKSLGNGVSPYEVIDKYGSDALRLYLGTIVEAYQDIAFKWEDLKTRYQSLNILINIYTYLIEYSRYYNINPAKLNINKFRWEDGYILNLIERSKRDIYYNLDQFNIWESGRILQKMINELSRFYIKSVRERIKQDPETVLYIIYRSLLEILNISAIIVPHISEYIYQKLREEYKLNEESILLIDIYKVNEELINDKIEEEHELFNYIIETGLRLRNELKINIRKPLKSIYIYSKSFSEALLSLINNKDINQLIKDYLNVKEIIYQDPDKDYIELNDIKIGYDINSYPELEEEWLYREIRRRIQDIRKENKLRKGQRAKIEIYSDNKVKDIILKYKDNLEKETDSTITIKDSKDSLNRSESIYEMEFFYNINIL
ncbi:isoleucine--tRNA ligase [Nanobdella aerobiophila]|uniref:Isoleucine--tRNA ligase n=1 Tax=Nanobdella aerobiophila TaxID=2586965 RepID=A0A915SKA5_9ARCH|nr:isoleucine--tRNA ligase [Nanobdella aerobiophila]BBL45196.1 isoleucine--tRNA ligase [Nanobdella aerobiophila]